MAFDKSKYDVDYQKKNYDRVSLLLPKGKKEELKEFAALQDISVNELIKTAIYKTYKINLD